ncbi:hypothetical protein [Verrucosispora sp. NA02020]|uniref:hypothetical protein n=1 Tax=Verrucosispora sp. NA02020 TaxID=2742132 RepID=UPI001591E05B|nr:hypothetical protein [Verrucosispora sp. NA02020]QKW13411.1 hypothetical protein HUT12_11880 [Verrucosispora sp. NA02020]
MLSTSHPHTTLALRRRTLHRATTTPLGVSAPTAAGADTTPGAAMPSEYLWGYAIRRQWPDGSHDLFGFTPDPQTAAHRLTRDRSYWRTGPIRPTAVYLVPTNDATVHHHPVTGCRHHSCPDNPDRRPTP